MNTIHNKNLFLFYFVLTMFLACGVFTSISAQAQTKGISLSPEAQAVYERGYAAAEQGKWVLAIKYFSEAQKAAPESPEVLFNLAFSCSNAGGRDILSIAWYRAYLSAAPKAANAQQVRKEIVSLEVKVESNIMDLISLAKDTAAEIIKDYEKSNAYKNIDEVQAGADDVSDTGERPGNITEVKFWTDLALEYQNKPPLADLQGFLKSLKGDKSPREVVSVLTSEVTKCLVDALRNLKANETMWSEQRCIEGDCYNGEGIHSYFAGGRYEGIWKDGKMHGRGTRTWPIGDKYVGEWKDGKMHGQGTLVWNDGTKYTGEWKEDEMHGQGSATLADGSLYEGEFQNNMKHGQGTITESDGFKYTGEWKNNEWHGQGSMTAPDGTTYTGEWMSGNMHGQGTHTFPNGVEYVGTFKDNKKNGQGTLTLPGGANYVGTFKDGDPNGQGTFTFPGGINYVGSFKNGNPDGHGIQSFPDGSKYVGEWKDGKRNGQGTLSWPDGFSYDGEWKDDKEHGHGTQSFPDGSKNVGEWINGEQVNE